MDKEKIIKAGEIASETKKYAKTIVKPGVPLLEIAEKIEAKIEELGGKPAFPTNLSINNIAAHYTPSHDDKTLAHGLIKVDFGVHVDGWVADNSFSVDLENSELNKNLITASDAALAEATKVMSVNIPVNEIGSAISGAVVMKGFNPIVNLCGHSIERYNLHSGITIPNIDDGRKIILKEGLYAVEPFVTNGSGKVRDGRPSGIYELTSEKNPRGPIAREVLAFIAEEYETLPFCSRWIVNRLGSKALLGLRELEANGNLHQFSQLVEASGGIVSQSENTFLVEKDKVTVTTI